MLKCQGLALVHVQKWSCSSTEDELQDCIKNKACFFHCVNKWSENPCMYNCTVLASQSMNFNHGFEASTCAHLKGSQAGDAMFSKVLIAISKKITLNSPKWEDRKSLKDHKDSHWLWGDLRKKAKNNGGSASVNIFFPCSPRTKLSS